MEHIDIHYYSRTGGEKKIIPVLYDVEQYENDPCRQIIHCKVAMPNSDIPNWLHPQKFDLLTHICDEISVVDYNAMAHDSELRTLDSEFFRYKVYSEIVFRELKKIAKKNES